MSRKYQEIWNRVKKNGHCVIEVKPIFWARVKKAIIKEKNADAAFKLLNDHDSFSLRFEFFADKDGVVRDKKKIILKQRLGFEGRVMTE